MKARVTIVAFNASLEMSIAAMRDLFAAAEAAEGGGEAHGCTPLVIATQDGQAVSTFSGAALNPDLAIHEISESELIIISGVWANVARFLADHRAVMRWLVDQYASGATIACMNSGAFLAAEAGLLKDRPATVFWRYEDEFRRRYPDVNLRPERSMTSADRLHCSSGIGSGLELGVFLVEKLYGTGVAEKVARNFLMGIHRESRELQTVLAPYRSHHDEKILAAQHWLEWNFSFVFALEELADRIGLGLRTFTRRFHKATGETALSYLHRIRIESAKAMLRNDSLTIEDIALRVGYQDTTHFGRLFRRYTGQTPGQYRRDTGA